MPWTIAKPFALHFCALRDSLAKREREVADPTLRLVIGLASCRAIVPSRQGWVAADPPTDGGSAFRFVISAYAKPRKP